MERDELQELDNEVNQLIQESNNVLYSSNLSETTKKTLLESYRNRLLGLKAKMNRVRRRVEHQEFLELLSSDNKDNAKGKM